MKDLTKGKPSTLILAFALPIFFANLLQLTYSLVDTRIVGTFLGEDALAAVGALAYIVWSIAAIFRAKGHRKDRAYSAALGAADICLTVYVLFCLMWGVNYWTDSFQDRAGITAQPVTETELEAVTRYFAEQLTAAADSVPRDETHRGKRPQRRFFSAAARSLSQLL